MNNQPKIAILPGSLRKHAYSKAIGHVLLDLCSENNHPATLLDLAKYHLPLLNQDDTQQAFSDNITQFINDLRQHHALIIVTPEHNHSLPASLKNAIDWASRKPPGSDLSQPFLGKPTMLISSSVGKMSGLKALVHLRDIMSALSAQVFATQRGYGEMGSIFTESGELKDHSFKEKIHADLTRFISYMTKLL